MDNTQNKCKVCSKRIVNHEKTIKCSQCLYLTHTKCLPTYNRQDIEYAIIETNHWTCPSCLSIIFPFNNIEDTPTFVSTVTNPTAHNLDLDSLNNMVYDPFDAGADDAGGGGALDDIDPDLNYLNSLGGTSQKNCKYYYSNTLHDEIKPKMANAKLSVLHLNIRSLPRNFDILLPTIHASGLNFNIIALSETWLKESNADCYGIPGYVHKYLTRGDKTGGGVSIYINQNWTYKIRTDLNINNDDIEILWVEIDKDSANTPTNLVLGTVYRRPGSDPSIFNSLINDTITSILAENKKCMHVGDYNLNLLN